MARITLNCVCSWTFFIPDSTQGHEVACPSCRVMVRIPGRKPGQAVFTAVEIALQHQRKAALHRMGVGLGIAVVVLGGLTWGVIALLSPSGPPPEEESASPRSGSASAGSRPSQRIVSVGPVEAPLAADRPTGAAAADLDRKKRDIYQTIQLINLAGIVSEVCRFRSLPEEHEALLRRLLELDGVVRANLDDLAQHNQKPPLEPYFLAGDRIVAFGQRDLLPLRGLDAARLLSGFLQTFRAGALEQAVVLRNGTKLTLFLHFPEETKELLQMSRHPALLVEARGGTPASAVPEPSTVSPEDIVEISPDSLRAVQARFDALPPGYKGFVPPEDLKHLEDLLVRKQGVLADLQFLKERVGEHLLPRFEAEQAQFKAKLLEIEGKLKEPTAVDVIHFNDGRKVEGTVIQQTPEHVRVKSRFGVVTIPSADVKNVVKGGGAAVEFPDKLKAAGRSTPQLVLLLDWCRDKGLRLEKEYVAYRILTVDAAHERSRRELGIPRPVLSGPLPATPGGPAPVISGAVVEAATKQIEALALETVQKFQTFSDVIEELKRRTEGVKVASSPAPVPGLPKPLMDVAAPLGFRAADLTVQDAREVGQWWGLLAPPDRAAFARYFGLLCAYARRGAGN